VIVKPKAQAPKPKKVAEKKAATKAAAKPKAKAIEKKEAPI